MQARIQIPKSSNKQTIPIFLQVPSKTRLCLTDAEVRRIKLNPGSHRGSGWMRTHIEFPASVPSVPVKALTGEAACRSSLLGVSAPVCLSAPPPCPPPSPPPVGCGFLLGDWWDFTPLTMDPPITLEPSVRSETDLGPPRLTPRARSQVTVLPVGPVPT